MVFVLPVFLAFLLVYHPHNATPTIIDRPIVYDDVRRQLSLEYLRDRHGLQKEEPTIEPCMVVVHWTQYPTFKQSFDAFFPARLPNVRPDIKNASPLNVSAQFMIDRDGTIYRLMPETAFARHIIGLNYCAIGIENVGNGTSAPLTAAQEKSNEELIRYLHKKYEIEYLIGHYEYTLFENHPLWKETDTGYRTKKEDPGEEFMEKLRTKLDDLHLKGAPDSTSVSK